MNFNEALQSMPAGYEPILQEDGRWGWKWHPGKEFSEQSFETIEELLMDAIRHEKSRQPP